MFPIANQSPRKKAVTAAPVTRTRTFLPPRRGWVRNENLAKPKEEGAYILDNWFPTAIGARARRGSTKHATIGGSVTAMMTYRNGGSEYLFAANTNAIYDVSAPVSPTAIPAAAVSGLTSGAWASVQFATAGGVFLRAVNGADTPLVFDGSTWSTSPALIGMTAANLSDVWSFKRRLFFVERDTLDAWYLSVDSIGGALTKLPLGAVFRLGGSLLFGSTWSYDAGSGLAEACVFVSTEGEVAIYEGTDPSSAADWQLKGVYRIGRPLGRAAKMKAGGDLLVATDAGFVSVGEAINKDAAAIAASAVSYPIESEWNIETARRVAQGSWAVEMWPTQQMAVVAMPTYGALPAYCYVVNIRTGAWGRYTGWNASCLALHGDRLFFGRPDGVVMEAETGGSDDGSIYTATYVGLPDDFGAGGATKVAKLARAILLSSLASNAKVFMLADYAAALPPPPNVAAAPSGTTWGSAVWGASTWGGTKQPERRWRTVSGQGARLAPGLMISFGSTAEPDIDLAQIDVQYEVGGPVS